MKKNISKAFTLVELIVVITILAVLATVAFISFQGYSVSSRDTVRMTNAKMVEKSLNFMVTKSLPLPWPDAYTRVSASGTVLSYQWYFASWAYKTIWMSEIPKDKTTGKYLSYAIDSTRSLFQIVTYLEQDNQFSSFQNQSYAADFYPYVTGENIWIIVDDQDELVSNDVDLLQDTLTNIWIVVGNKSTLYGDQDEVFSALLNTRKTLADEQNLWDLDNSLVLYTDMKTTVNDGWVVKLMDMSQNNNHLVCYNNTQVDCNNAGGLAFSKQGIYFDWVDDYILQSNSILNGSDEQTIIIKTQYDFDIDGEGNLFFYQGRWWVKAYPDYVRLEVWGYSWVDGRWAARLKTGSFDTNKQNIIVARINNPLDMNTPRVSWDVDMFINGVKNSNTFSHIWNSSELFNNLFIGTYDSNLGFFNGYIWEVKVYNRALSDAEISAYK